MARYYLWNRSPIPNGAILEPAAYRLASRSIEVHECRFDVSGARPARHPKCQVAR
jgi:hypothetical protein